MIWGITMSIRPIVFKASCIKTLSAVEADALRSNQHELNGVAQLKHLFGVERTEMPASFSIRGSDVIHSSNVTWYDAREAHVTRSEYRLYFQTNPVMSAAQEGDNIIIGFDHSNNLHCELIRQGTAGHEFINEWMTA